MMAPPFNIVTIVGARPQFIKAAVVSKALRAERRFIREILVHTGQHYDYRMSELFFKELKLPKPVYHLEIGSHDQGKQTGLMLEKIEIVLKKENPDMVLVYGDTNSTLAGALAASKLHIPVAHVEAGMRSYNKRMSEEMNRIVTDHLSDILFCSSDSAVGNLRKEGIAHQNGKTAVLNVGDVMFDALKNFYPKAFLKSKILEKLKLKPKRYYLATIHRAENTDDLKKLETIFRALNEIASEGHAVVMPMHPRTVKALKRLNIIYFSKNFSRILPLSYLDMLMLEKNASGIFTDSGGVQKEAYFFEVPTVTLRDETEWEETIKSGLNRLTRVEQKAIKRAFKKISTYKRLNDLSGVYGDGTAANRITEYLKTYFVALQ